MASTKSTGSTKKRQVKKVPAAKKTSAKPKKKTRTKKIAKKKKPGAFHELKKTVLGIAILLAVCLTVAMFGDLLFKSNHPVPPKIQAAPKVPPVVQPQVLAPSPRKPNPKKTPKPPETKAQAVIEPKILTIAQGLKKKELTPGRSSITMTPVLKEGSAIIYEVYDDVTPAPPKKVVPPKKYGSTPLIAIIIDDIGYDKRLAMELLSIDKNITFSILPFSPVGKQLARSLSAKGAELMLHLPMEPTQYPKINPGPGALLSSMSPDELLIQLHKNIQAVPGTVGANNHMGSRLTADSDKMNQIFTVLKKNHLFFIDSKTSPKSKGEQSARMFQLKFSQRDVFLDNFQNVEYISGQIKKLIKQAQAHGSAIGIGHPHQATLDALKQELPKIRGKVRLVPASGLVHIPET